MCFSPLQFGASALYFSINMKLMNHFTLEIS